MSFLSCLPCVFVIEKDYEILINTKECGIAHIEIGGEAFYAENSGVLCTEKTYTKIRFPQSVLDKAECYTVVFRQTIERKAYFSKLMPAERETFSFKPLKKTENIHLFYISDVHCEYEKGRKTAAFFGDDVDLFVVNGDIAEVNHVENFVKVAEFVGSISQGRIPVIFSRGNHDTRGRYAEFFTDYFPCINKKTYYTFQIGCISGVVLDCGEDKPDGIFLEEYQDYVYGGVNVFEAYRRAEAVWLQKLPQQSGTIHLAISHVCPMQTTRHKGDIFDIEREVYTQWEQALERLGTDIMLCGHIHDTYILQPGSPDSIIPHSFPVVVGAGANRGGEHLNGAALTLNPDGAKVQFVNDTHTVYQEETLHFTR